MAKCNDSYSKFCTNIDVRTCSNSYHVSQFPEQKHRGRSYAAVSCSPNIKDFENWWSRSFLSGAQINVAANRSYKLMCITFMLPCIVIDFLLNNQPDALIIQIYSVIKLYMFRVSSLPIIRSFLLYIRHWLSFMQVLMTASKQSQDGTQFNPGPARKLSTSLYDIYHCWVYSE
jgi:hypothetical protein